MADLSTYTLTITSGLDYSNAVPIAQQQIPTLWMPAAWTAANITFEFATSNDDPGIAGAAWRKWYTDTGEVTLPAAANRVLQAPSGVLAPAGARWLRLRSGIDGALVVQGADRIITCILRRF